MGPTNDVHYREVFAIKCPLHKGFFYESLNVISSVPEKSVSFREVSAIKNVRYKQVSL